MSNYRQKLKCTYLTNCVFCMNVADAKLPQFFYNAVNANLKPATSETFFVATEIMR